MGTVCSSAERPLSDRDIIDRCRTNNSDHLNEGSTKKGKEGLEIPGLNQSSFDNDYEKGESLASKVSEVTNSATGVKYVMYSLPKRKLPCKDPAKILDLLMTLRKIDHHHVCRLIESFDDGPKIILIYEYCDGGLLLDELAASEDVKEAYISIIARQVLSGIAASHVDGVAHGWLAPKNIMLTSEGQVKITDFGLADVLKANAIDSAPESVHHRPPESIDASEKNEPVQMDVTRADIWSLGAIVYQLLTNEPPFQGSTPKEVGKRILSCKGCPLGNTALQACSSECRQFLGQCMQVDPQERPTAAELLKHPWMLAARETENKDRRASIEPKPKKKGKKKIDSTKIDGNIIQHIKTYGAETEFKKQMMKQVATNMPRSKILELEDAFCEMDTSGDGYLTLTELRDGLVKHSEVRRNIPETSLESLFSAIDSDGNGKISIREFVTATIDAHDVIVEDVLYATFKRLDKDNSGTLTLDELRFILVESEGALSQSQVDDILKAINTEIQGNEVTFQDFMELLTEEGGKARRGKPKKAPEPIDGQKSTGIAVPVLSRRIMWGCGSCASMQRCERRNYAKR